MEIFTGFYEDACRLVVCAKDLPQESRNIQTVMPTGVKEMEKELKPGDEKGIITYPVIQSLSEEQVKQLLGPGVLHYGVRDQYSDRDSSLEPYVWRREEGTYAVVQMWLVKYDEAFQSDFQITYTNPDPKRFDPRAVAELQRALRILYRGTAADGKDRPVRYCRRRVKNNKRVCGDD